MDERRNKRSGPMTLLFASPRFRRLTACTLAVVILYWGMMGPLSWYNRHGYLTEPMKASVRVLYAPIRQLCRMSPVINEYIGNEFGELWKEPGTAP
ncbi:MAG: hypothetical protein ACT4QC_11370 [Planctomycetaceae bacterium]